jgi:hypothetical protein
MTDDDGAAVEYGHRVHPVLHIVKPVATIATVWAAREVITRAYVRATGRAAPVPSPRA